MIYCTNCGSHNTHDTLTASGEPGMDYECQDCGHCFTLPRRDI